MTKAIKKGDILRHKSTKRCYQVVMFTDVVTVADVESIAEKGVTGLLLGDFWKLSANYLKENFELL